ncbi:MAG: right-handed parallel beta-helix repeat-containing protein [Burkholderiaceae bacterium]|jgi:hypothetical protein|nr:right-handed parallel beta-helix repeat-containing protein [Burkholderiaceae bacterium]
MANDFSSVRLDPLRDYAALELKQGGVLIDADANELVGILDRRLRALAGDVLGRSSVSATTADAFKIGVAGAQLTIGRGRMYVDGLLAENHGAGKPGFDPLLAEAQKTDAIAYTGQPYLPNPPALPDKGRHLVYLDVWNREVTHLEQPNLVESAVGVDATSRIQTVWQVRVVAENAAKEVSCASPDEEVSGWPPIIAPSTGVLSTGTVEVAAVDDPCELPPTGGYRGLENQLYRVEIHHPGVPAKKGKGATFKWSRENASVGSRVASIISPTQLELTTLGRDDLLSFKTGHWVEIIDDVREFSLQPGEMRQIEIDDATRRIIKFTPPLPADMLPSGGDPNNAFAAQRNLRVRRWDQAHKVFSTDANGQLVEQDDLSLASSGGVIKVPDSATTLLLENGVTVRFDFTGATGFKTGDYWVFAARTADASVELLDHAPPRGTHHHYARLAIWDADTKQIVSDCRHPWPPSQQQDCCCTACVTVASHLSGEFTIQAAVDKLAKTGGAICLESGQYPLKEPVRMDSVNAVHIRGQGASTVIVAGNGGAFIIAHSAAVRIENLHIISSGRQPVIAVQTAQGLILRQLDITVVPSNQNRYGSAISLQGVVAGAAITDNAINAPIGILALDPLAPKPKADAGALDSLLIYGLTISRNVLRSAQRAIALDGNVAHLIETRIEANDILACTEAALSATGIGLPGARLVVGRNHMQILGHGIRCAVSDALITDNKIAHMTPVTELTDDDRLQPGPRPADSPAEVVVVNAAGPANSSIGIELAPGSIDHVLGQCQIRANQIQGFGAAGVMINAPLRDLVIQSNTILGCGNGILSSAVETGAILIKNNLLNGIVASRTADASSVVGIGVLMADSATIAGNTLLNLRNPRQGSLFGILTAVVGHAQISDNDLRDIAPSVDQAVGICVAIPRFDFQLEHNHVERETTPSADAPSGNWMALWVQGDAGDAATDLPFFVYRFNAEGAIVLEQNRVSWVKSATGVKGLIAGNVMAGSSSARAVVQVTTDECLFCNNIVDARLKEGIAVMLTAPIAIVNANRVTRPAPAQRSEVAIQIEADAKTVTVLGNITTGAIRIGNTLLGAPWAALNVAM